MLDGDSEPERQSASAAGAVVAVRQWSTPLAVRQLPNLALRGFVVVAPLVLLFCGLEVSQRAGRAAAEALYPLSFGSAVLRHAVMSAVAFGFLVLPLATIEQLFPTARPSLRSYAIGMAGWVLAWVLGYAVGITSQEAIGLLGLTPALVVKVSSFGMTTAIALILLNLFVFDFFYYWFHRMQHRFAALWRLHAVHHSIRNLNAIMSFHHPIEDLLRIVPITLPLAALVRFDGAPVVPLLSALLAAMGQFIHTDTRLNFGPFRVILGDGHYHRIHHSVRDEHRSRNFAAFFPIWDRIFGTLHMPKCGEYPPVGLKGKPNGMTMQEYFLGITSD
ncbi:MAG TPA: sterol desaturase family protein [Stellaceae bacterium]|nr:sterol desaturase family protein [Stellaceae bacterium]